MSSPIRRTFTTSWGPQTRGIDQAALKVTTIRVLKTTLMGSWHLLLEISTTPRGAPGALAISELVRHRPSASYSSMIRACLTMSTDFSNREVMMDPRTRHSSRLSLDWRTTLAALASRAGSASSCETCPLTQQHRGYFPILVRSQVLTKRLSRRRCPTICHITSWMSVSRSKSKINTVQCLQ